MVHISSEAVRTQKREIEVGDSIRHFMKILGRPASLTRCIALHHKTPLHPNTHAG